MKIAKLNSENQSTPRKSSNFKLLCEKSSIAISSILEEAFENAPTFPLMAKVTNCKFLAKPHALPSKALFIGEVTENIPNGLGYHLDNTGKYYEGFFENGLFSGKGRIFLPDGEILIGNWENGFIENGKILYFNGRVYEGELQNLMSEGKGKETSDDFVYEGSFCKGKKNGIGKVKWNDDSYYEGEFVNGRIEGNGIYHSSEYDFEGLWKANKMHGKGIKTWADGKYEGEMQKGLKHGYGVLETSNKKYSGYWKDDKEDGKGQLEENGICIQGYWRKGEFLNEIGEDEEDQKSSNLKNADFEIPEKIQKKFEKILKIKIEYDQADEENEFIPVTGKWIKYAKGAYFGDIDSNGLPEGRGLFISSSLVYEGHWEAGNRNGFGRQVNIHKELYIGNWLNNYKFGFGALHKNDFIYTGEWEGNKFNRRGALFSKNLVYDGDWGNGVQHGNGTLEYPDGKYYTGEFFSGKVKGLGKIVYSNGSGFEGTWDNGEISSISAKFKEKKNLSDSDEEANEEFQDAKELLSSLLE